MKALLFVATLSLLACAPSNHVPLAPLDGGRSPDAPPVVSTDLFSASRDTAPETTSLASLCGPSAAAVDRAPFREAVFYEVFVRSFRDSDGDGVGDLQGLIEKLDYLNDGDPATDDDLGVTALWLMPVTASPSYHGYDVTDYRAIAPDYGTMADFDALVAAAHERGVSVFIDLVLNHSSSLHPWFQDADVGEAHRDWYVWRDEDPGWGKPWDWGASPWHQRGDSWYYGLFWAGMPDLNYANPAVRDEALDIARFWLARGVDGFRLDAVRYLVETGPEVGQSDTPETHAFWRELRELLQAEYPAAALIGEAWTGRDEVMPYYGSLEAPALHMLFDFDLQKAIEDAFRLGTGAPLRAALCAMTRARPAHGQDAVFLSNHDQVRAASAVARGEADRRLLALLLLSFEGSPFLYYGEEIGLPNGSALGDEAKRQPMRWQEGPLAGFTEAARAWQAPYAGEDAPDVASQLGEPESLLSWYRRLIRLRQSSPALRGGVSTVLTSERLSHPELLAFVREAEGERVLVLANLSTVELRDVRVTLDVSPGPPTPLLDSPAARAEGEVLRLESLAARTGGLWRL